jgi:hypothetical protein
MLDVLEIASAQYRINFIEVEAPILKVLAIQVLCTVKIRRKRDCF